MTGKAFAGREVLRRGGVLLLAPEGATEVPVRLRALEERFDGDTFPFCWADTCPVLLDRAALPMLIATPKAAAEKMKAQHNCRWRSSWSTP